MRLAILGGSFNPVHLGHLFVADAALTALHYDRVLMIPAYKSPFKLAAEGMEDSAAARLEMLAASIAGDPRLTIDNCEVRREGISYTVDTVKDIIRRYCPDRKPGLIIGDDLAADFPKWFKSDEILELADLIIARRLHSEKLECPYPNQQITNEVMEISSALVRERIGTGGSWRYLVPTGARAIIEDRGLYGFVRYPGNTSTGKEELGHKIVVRVEQAARESLSLDRFLHSRNTALLAWDLCRRFGLDQHHGYLAGIAHDIAKELDEDTLLKLAKSDGQGLSKLEKKKTSLLHGRAAAVVLSERFGIHNKDVLEAVALHIAGSPDMGPLAKVVYIADKVEVSREHVEPELRALCCAKAGEGPPLNDMFAAVLNQTVSYLRSKKLELSEETYLLLEKMKDR